MIKQVFIWKTLALLSFAIIGAGCSSSPSTDNDFKPSYSWLFYQNTNPYIISQLEDEDIQFVEHGDTMLLIIPTDTYFENNSSELNEISNVYKGLNNVVKLIRKYPKTCQINVAGFTDDSSDSETQKTLTQGQAETISSYLWANGVSPSLLKTQGYGDLYPIGSNKSMHSSSYNRRVEIQWTSPVCAGAVSPAPPCPPASCHSSSTTSQQKSTVPTKLK